MARPKRSLFQAVLAAGLLLLVACCSLPPSPAATLPRTTPTVLLSAVEDLADAFIAAYKVERAADYLALFSDEALYLDNSTPFRSDAVAIPICHCASEITRLFKNTDFGMKLDSRIVSRDGRFVVLTGTYANTGKDGKPASVPIVVVLEVRGGRIVREDQYYDNSAFY